MAEFIAHRFQVNLFAAEGSAGAGILCAGAFSEVSGLEASMTPKTVKEGGRNWGEVQLAGPTNFSTIVLKRGITEIGDLWRWFDLVGNRANYNLRMSGEIRVLSNHQPDQVVLQYRLQNVLPIKFKGPDLSATASQVAVEELHLAHEGLTLERPAGAKNHDG